MQVRDEERLTQLKEEIIAMSSRLTDEQLHDLADFIRFVLDLLAK